MHAESSVTDRTDRDSVVVGLRSYVEFVETEAAIGLAILVVLFRNRRTINVQDLDTLRG